MWAITKISVKTVTQPTGRSHNRSKIPQYLSRNSEKLDTLNNQFKVPESSEITLLGKANRKINQVLIFDSESSFSENPFSTDFKFNLPALKQDRKYSLLIVDQFGFSPREPIIISQKIQNDLPPSVNLSPLTDTSPVLLFETRKVSFRNEDDFGLKECSLTCSLFRGEKKIKDLESSAKIFLKLKQRNTSYHSHSTPA